MDPTGTLLASIVENDFASNRVRKELKANDFDALGRSSEDLDRKRDIVSADLHIEDADALWRFVATRTTMNDEARIHVDRVAVEPIAGDRPILLGERGDIEKSGRENQRAFDRGSGLDDLDFDVIGSANFRLSASLEKHDACSGSDLESDLEGVQR
jgi:hypothetical protein